MIISSPASKTPSAHVRLWRAIECNCLQSLREALNDGANPNGGMGGWLPLGKALRRDHPALAMALIESGADIHRADQGHPLVELAATGDGREEILARMLQQGATASAEALRLAARCHNARAVELLLAHGAPANEYTNNHYPALCHWMQAGQAPIPQALLRATLEGPLELPAARLVSEHCAKNRNEQVMHALHASDFPSPAWQTFLLHAIHSQWQAGIAFVLAHQLAPTERMDYTQNAILMAVGNGLRNARVKRPWMDLLDSLIDYGFHPSQPSWTLVHGASEQEDRWTDAPVFLEIIRYSSKPGRWPLIQHFLAKGADPASRYGDTKGHNRFCGLAHLLIQMEDMACLEKLLRRAPARLWEQGNDPGLVATLLDNPLDAHTVHRLDWLFGLGAQAHRPDSEGRGAFEVLLDQLDTTLLRRRQRQAVSFEHLQTIGATLVRHGCALDTPDRMGMDPIQRLEQLGGELYRSIAAAWLAASLRANTASSSFQAGARRL